VGGELLLHELGGDGVDADDGGLDQDVKGELIDATGRAPAGLEELPDGAVGEQLLLRARLTELEADIVAGVLEVERLEPVYEAEARVERLQGGVLESAEQRVGAGDEDAEAVLGVHGVIGEASQDVEEFGAHGLGIIEHEERVGPLLGAVGGEVAVGLIEEVARVVPHGKVERAVDGTEKTGEGGARVREHDDAEAGLVEGPGEAADRDGFAGTAGSGDQRHAPDLGPHLQAMEQFALGPGVEHLVVPHGLSEGQSDEGEVALEANLDRFGKGAGAHDVGSLSWLCRWSRRTSAWESRGWRVRKPSTSSATRTGS
jgi:hypothetical protein